MWVYQPLKLLDTRKNKQVVVVVMAIVCGELRTVCRCAINRFYELFVNIGVCVFCLSVRLLIGIIVVRWFLRSFAIMCADPATISWKSNMEAQSTSNSKTLCNKCGSRLRPPTTTCLL